MCYKSFDVKLCTAWLLGLCFLLLARWNSFLFVGSLMVMIVGILKESLICIMKLEEIKVKSNTVPWNAWFLVDWCRKWKNIFDHVLHLWHCSISQVQKLTLSCIWNATTLSATSCWFSVQEEKEKLPKHSYEKWILIILGSFCFQSCFLSECINF